MIDATRAVVGVKNFRGMKNAPRGECKSVKHVDGVVAMSSGGQSTLKQYGRGGVVFMMSACVTCDVRV